MTDDMDTYWYTDDTCSACGKRVSTNGKGALFCDCPHETKHLDSWRECSHTHEEGGQCIQCKRCRRWLRPSEFYGGVCEGRHAMR